MRRLGLGLFWLNWFSCPSRSWPVCCRCCWWLFPRCITSEVVTISAAAQLLTGRWWRYLLAGLFFSLATAIGFLLCVLPGIAVALVTPVFVNRIFVSEMTIGEAFAQSFQVVYRSENGLSFVGLEVLTGIVVAFLALITCGLGGFVVIPMASFFLQNVAYERGLLR